MCFGSLVLQLCSGCGCPASWLPWAPAAWGESRSAAAAVAHISACSSHQLCQDACQPSDAFL